MDEERGRASSWSHYVTAEQQEGRKSSGGVVGRPEDGGDVRGEENKMGA